MTESATAVWHYDKPTSLAGALQHGLGRGAHRALRDPAAPAAVLACLERDYRWDWLVDERAVYLARLIRDLSMPTLPILALLRERALDDEDNAFSNALEVLEVLGRCGDGSAVDGLREYVRDGPQWVEVLETIARDWPRELWDDLLPVARTRLGKRDGDGDPHWRGQPWRDWAAVDDVIAARVEGFQPHRTRWPYEQTPTDDLLALLRAGGTDRQKAVLRELNRRGPQPALLAVADELPANELRGQLGRAIRMLGAQAVPLARAWATPAAHPMVWTAYLVLAEHGDDSDLPALVAGWDWLDRRTGDLCGYDALATGIARIGGPAAQAAVPRLRRAWFTPHTYERAAYLRAVTLLDPDGANRFLAEGVWDCESDVRQFAATHAPLDELTRDRLGYLRDDPMETPDVRAAAAARLA